MTTTYFKFHFDPGHGWLEVTPKQIRDVGLNISDFSIYSYKKGNRLFLEEDCDASKFILAFKAKFGDAIAFKDLYTKGDFPEDNGLIPIHYGSSI